MKNILITGGAGFIGSHLSLKLAKKGYNVTILDNLSPQIHGNNPEVSSSLYQSIADKVNFIKGDVLNRNDWITSLQNQDVLVHLAAETGTGQSMYEIKRYSDVNIGGTALLLDILAKEKHRIQKVIVASSRALYGEGKYISEEFGIVYPGHRSAEDMDKGDFEVKYPNCFKALKLVATDESSKIHPSSVYGITKQTQEQLVMTVCRSLKITPLAFRYQNVYGPGQSLKNPYTGILSIFSTQIKHGNTLNVFEDGKESRDFVYIDDVVDATILGLEHDSETDGIYNVGTGVNTDVNQLANSLIEYLGISVPVEVTGNYRVGDIRHNYADLSKINHELGFEPSVSFQQGLKSFVEWVKEQPIEKDTYSSSINEMKSKGLYK